MYYQNLNQGNYAAITKRHMKWVSKKLSQDPLSFVLNLLIRWRTLHVFNWKRTVTSDFLTSNIKGTLDFSQGTILTKKWAKIFSKKN